MTQRSIRRFARGGLMAGLPLLLGACAPASSTVTATPQAAAPGSTWAVQARVDVNPGAQPVPGVVPESLSADEFSRLDGQLSEVVQTYYTRAGETLPALPGSERSGVLRQGQGIHLPFKLPAGTGQDRVHLLLVCDDSCVAQLTVSTPDGQALRGTPPLRLGRGGNAWLGVTVPLTRPEASEVVVTVSRRECPADRCAFLLRAVPE